MITPGAIRAAKKVWAILIGTEHDDDDLLDYIAAIIASETAAPEMLEVCKCLDFYQRKFEVDAMQPGGMPGNEYYSEQMMVIVNHARAAIVKEKG